MASSPSSDGPEPEPLPKTFVLELTRRCNHRCSYCYAVWGHQTSPPDASRGSDEMSVNELKELIARLQDEAPVENLALSGGEPMLRDDLSELMDFVAGRGIAPVLITNGTLLTPSRVAAGPHPSVYEVTLLSFRREVHDGLTGRRGAWDAAVDGMANVHQAHQDLAAVFVATRQNFMDLYKTAELAIALGAFGLMYNRVNLSAQSFPNADRLLPTPAMIRENLDMLEEIGHKYGLPIAVSVVIEPCVIDISKYTRVHFGWCPLAGEKSYFTIDPGGDLRVCNHSPTVLGNLRHDSFREIYYHHPYVRRFRETWPVECSDCDPELKQMCGGGCKAAAEQCYGTLSRVDPFVTLSHLQEAGGP